MRIGYGLNLEQTQKLIMTPELRQAIAVLQLSALELSNYVEQQMLENPLLEVVEDSVDKGMESNPEESLSQDKDQKSENDWDMNWEEYFQYQDEPISREYDPEAGQNSRFEPFVTTAPSLHEHLLEQVHIQKANISQELLEYIIGNLDDNGYLSMPLEEIAKQLQLPLEEVEKGLRYIQTLDPLGVGARSLEECLRLQLPLLEHCPPQMSEFLNHLEELAAGKLNKIANQMKITPSQVQEMADLLRTLDPKPGRRFPGSGDVRYIVPDVMIEEVEGEFIILVNDVTVPRLGVNQAYRQVLNQNSETELRKFVEQKLNAAVWLIRSIEQRRLTLYKVADAIVRRQQDFLRKGIQYLKPLTLKDIAEAIGVHESTVSRATANKYVQTPRGIFEFKYFFATGLGSEQEITATGIKQALKEIIAGEDPKNPYSDQKISEILKERNIEISRRTVAKYRDELGIPSTVMRKRY